MYKKNLFIIAIFFLSFVSLSASSVSSSVASPANRFAGIYPILSSTDEEEVLGGLLVDVAPLEVIWGRYFDGDLPDDWMDFREATAILAGFTEREFVILDFEVSAFITDTYLKIRGAENRILEILLESNGRARMATKEGEHVTMYQLGEPTPLE